MPPPATSVRVSVQWDDEPVYAGDDLKCTIIFRNVAPSSSESSSSRTGAKPNGMVMGGERRQKVAPVNASQAGLRQRPHQAPQAPPTSARGHRQTMSLSVPSNRGLPKPKPGSAIGPSTGTTGMERKHQRSVSIISLGASENDGRRSQLHNANGAGRLPERRHARATSLQIPPMRASIANGASISPASTEFSHSARPPATSRHSSSATLADLPTMPASGYSSRTTRRPGILTAPTTPALSSGAGTFLRSPHYPFKFPAGSPSAQPRSPMMFDASSPMVAFPALETPSSVSAARSRADSESLAPIAKVVSALSLNGASPRSSGEFFTLSNNSTETLASDYVAHPPQRLLPRPGHTRKVSNLVPSQHHKEPESLMMGYAQVMGSFTLDGSLVNQAPFEEVKRKGVVGGQGGGGVVGVDTKNDGWLFGGLGWGSIGESIGGLLGNGELSSIKEMRSSANSRAIPLLSTPQSILFVDLHLAPGESRAYRYCFTLPKGLPPSHKGKAIRISYNLVIGTQRAATSQHQQQVRQVEIPFRVFSGTNAQGEPLGHDLLLPHIILRDEARTTSLGSASMTPKEAPDPPPAASSLQDFYAYIDSLLAEPSRDASRVALLSPVDTPRNRQLSLVDFPSSTKDLINLAIHRSNFGAPSARSTHRFDIARNGRRVATIALARSAYRLGETIIAAIDLSHTEISSYALHAILETAETVDPSLALRSNASIYRVTRKTHASQSEVTLFAQRVICALRIPPTATPEFISSGVSLTWTFRVEFVTPRIAGEDDDSSGSRRHVLEDISADERGTILAAIQGLSCESFEVGIPLRIYGPVSDSSGMEASTGEGLPI